MTAEIGIFSPPTSKSAPPNSSIFRTLPFAVTYAPPCFLASGWNQVTQTREHPMWNGITNGAWFYFVHSYYAKPTEADLTVGTTFYGEEVTVAVARDNVFATQFHPEKSAAAGLALYQNFLTWNP